jgi:hypothetical protein
MPLKAEFIHLPALRVFRTDEEPIHPSTYPACTLGVPLCSESHAIDSFLREHLEPGLSRIRYFGEAQGAEETRPRRREALATDYTLSWIRNQNQLSTELRIHQPKLTCSHAEMNGPSAGGEPIGNSSSPGAGRGSTARESQVQNRDRKETRRPRPPRFRVNSNRARKRASRPIQMFSGPARH